MFVKQTSAESQCERGPSSCHNHFTSSFSFCGKQTQQLKVPGENVRQPLIMPDVIMIFTSLLCSPSAPSVSHQTFASSLIPVNVLTSRCADLTRMYLNAFSKDTRRKVPATYKSSMTAGKAVAAMYLEITRHQKPSNHLPFLNVGGAAVAGGGGAEPRTKRSHSQYFTVQAYSMHEDF